MKRISNVKLTVWITFSLSILGQFAFVPSASAACGPCDEGISLNDCEKPEKSTCCPVQCGTQCTSLTDSAMKQMPAACSTCSTIFNGMQLAPVTVAASPILAAMKLWTAEKCAGAIVDSLCIGGTKTGSCCKKTINEGQPNGSEKVEKEVCANGTETWYADCVCKIQEGLVTLNHGATYAACAEDCKKKEGTLFGGIALHPPKSGQPAGRSSSDQQFQNALCFTREQCNEAIEGGGVFESSGDCSGGKGKCLAPEPTVELSSSVLGVTQVMGLRRYVDLMFKYMLSIVVMAATIMLIWGGFKYIIGSSAGDIGSAKESMSNALIGLVLSFTAVTLLNTLNPAVTRYDKLDVYLVNKVLFAALTYCDDYKSAPGKSLKFAAAGEPPGSAALDSAQFGLDQAGALCGNSYYPEGFGGSTCKGRACPTKGQICLSCEGSNEAACQGATEGSACSAKAMAGDIGHANGRKPLKVYALGVCRSIQPPNNLQKVVDNIPAKIEMQLKDAGAGKVQFTHGPGAGEYAKLVTACSGDKGGLVGILFGLVYKDTDGSKLKEVGTGIAEAGAAVGAPGGVAVGAAINAAGSTINDVMIVSRKDCHGSSFFSGYADGTGHSDLADMQTAVFCGWHRQAESPKAPSVMNTMFNANDATPALSPYWLPAEVENALKGEGSIPCNFFMNDANAPSDPGTKLMGGCKAGFIPGQDDK